MIGCTCVTCQSPDPRDKRWRPSIYLELADGTCVLVDTTPDLRTQALAFGLTRVDAVLFTHSHADHVLGLDDLRAYNRRHRGAIPCYGDDRTLADLRHMFRYVFHPDGEGGGVPKISLTLIGGRFCLGRQECVPIPLLHGRRPIYGYRFGRFAYLTDCSAIPEASWPLLDGVEVLVLDALRHRPHPTHFSLAESLEIVARLRPTRTLFTHMCHDLPHAATCERLPPGVELAYDGLKIDVD
ncbi:MAG: MBL fold metallo-hydrolase [Acidobacteria bacterium]|nr:MBL fold metallo-hydrolase [Acidobacteriota bacterium]